MSLSVREVLLDEIALDAHLRRALEVLLAELHLGDLLVGVEEGIDLLAHLLESCPGILLLLLQDRIVGIDHGDEPLTPLYDDTLGDVGVDIVLLLDSLGVDILTIRGEDHRLDTP